MTETGDVVGVPQGGNPAFKGFIYQKQVTVLVALQLLLDRERGLEEIVIEPVSQEDIEATVEEALSTLVCSAGTKLVIQIKFRGAGQWSAKEFANLLKQKTKQGKAGPAPRDRGLAMLLSDPASRYILITNSSVDVTLSDARIARVDHPVKADFLPTNLSLSASDKVSLTGRWGIVEGLGVELLQAKTTLLLESVGHVPVSRLPQVTRQLEQLVEIRMQGESAPLTRQQVLQLIASAGGIPERDPELHEFIEPLAWERAQGLLKARHALLLIGPPGYGKSLLAKKLVNQLRCQPKPFEVVTQQGGYPEIERCLALPGPYVFYLDDPWGQSKLEAHAVDWSVHLPGLLRRASADKLFVITSRADIFQLGKVGALESPWRDIRCQIVPEDFPEALRWEILAIKLKNQPDWKMAFAAGHRTWILTYLESPLAIDRFANVLKSCAAVGDASIEHMIEVAQVESISRIVRQQVSSWPSKNVECATVLWALIRRNARVSVGHLTDIRQELDALPRPLEIDLEHFVEHFGISTLTQDGTGKIGGHGKVIEAIEEVISAQKATVERTLRSLIEALMNLRARAADFDFDFELHHTLEAARSFSERPLALPAALQQRIDRFFGQRLGAADFTNFDYYLERSLFWMSSAYPPRQLLAYLHTVGQDDEDLPARKRHLPTLSAGDLALFQKDHSVGEVLRAWVTNQLANDRVVYDGLNLFQWLSAFALNLRESFVSACHAVVSSQNLRLNTGAVFECAIRLKAAAPDEVFAWIEDLETRLEEERADRDCSDAIGMTGIEDAYVELEQSEIEQLEVDTLNQALIGYVRARRELEGEHWLSGHPRPDLLLPAWEAVVQASGTPVELQRYRTMRRQLWEPQWDLKQLSNEMGCVDSNWARDLDVAARVDHLGRYALQHHHDIVWVIDALYQMESPEYLCVLVDWLHKNPAFISQESVTLLLGHDHYEVRQLALECFAPMADERRLPRWLFLVMDRDHSAYVRLSLCKVIGSLAWKEGASCLKRLISDSRDFNKARPDGHKVDYRVARTAARSFAKIAPIDESVLSEIRAFVGEGCLASLDNEVHQLLTEFLSHQ